METIVAKEGVHTQCSSSHTANNGEFSIFRAVLHSNMPCVGGAKVRVLPVM